MALLLLSPLASLISFCGGTVVSSTYFPYAIAPCLHALRISLVYRGRVRATGNEAKVGWAVDLAGFFLMVSPHSY